MTVDLITAKLRPGTGWWRSKRWWIGILLLVITAIGYLDRQALSFSARPIRDEFGLDNEDYGLITGAFLAMYALGQIVSGPLIDRFGTRRSLGWAVGWWSFATLLHAFCTGFASLFSARAFLGLTEAANLPAAIKAVAEWFPRAERSMGTALITVGIGLGAIIAPPLIGVIVAFFGWRWAFALPAMAGFLWLFLWYRLYYLPELDPRIGVEERALILRERVAPAVERPPPWRSFLRYRQVWGLMLARAIGDGAFYFMAFKLADYLATERGMGLLRIAWVGAIPFIAADLGSLAGGWTGMRLIRRGFSVHQSRMTMMWVGALIVPALAIGVYADTAAFVVAGVSLALFGTQIKSSALFSLPADMFPARDVATVWGLCGAAGSFMAAIFQWLSGWLIDGFGYQPVFLIIACMHILSVLAIMLVVRRIEVVQAAS
jgi:ACS family hexuronate transporter-like MFS transporter